MRAVRLLGLLALCALLAVPTSGAARTRSSLTLRPFLSGLDAPLYLAATKSQPNTVYVVEQAGRIRVATSGKLRAQPFLDIRSKVKSGGEQGLLSVAFHPNYARNHKLYVNYTDVNGDTRVVELRSRNGVAARTGRQLLFAKQPYSNTTEASFSSDRTGGCTSAWATAARAAIRRTARRTSAAGSESC